MVVVSLGTGEFKRPIKYGDATNWGQLEWAQPIINIVLKGSNSTVDYQLQQILQYDGPKRSYFRFQIEFGQDTSIDDASDSNLKYLMDLARAYIGQPDTQDTLASSALCSPPELPAWCSRYRLGRSAARPQRVALRPVGSAWLASKGPCPRRPAGKPAGHRHRTGRHRANHRRRPGDQQCRLHDVGRPGSCCRA